MDWFDSFVEQTAKKWAKDSEKFLMKSASIQTLAKQLLAELNVTNNEIGDIGEGIVQKIIVKIGYNAVLSPGSRTPADIWANFDYENVFHVGLVQVKTTYSGIEPAELDTDDEAIFRVFRKYVFRKLQEEKIVPKDIKGKQMIVSSGYAGVRLKKNLTRGSHSGYYMGSTYSKELTQGWDGIRKELLAFHQLQIPK